MEQTLQKEKVYHKDHRIFSKPLFIQSLKANWLMWLILTGAGAVIISIINLVMGSQNLIVQINMTAVNQYIADENMQWLQILGFMQVMGFSLSRIQTMSSIDVMAVFNDVVYSIAGVLLPLIFVIITSNKLVASQVDDGSMAYVLSTPTSRKRVIFTQFAFLIVALIAMYIVQTGFALGSEVIGYGVSKANPIRTLLLNLDGMIAMLAFGGISFMCSCIFSRSKYSLGLGGGFCVFCFLATILGLFGSDVFVSLGVGVKAMNVFNYLTLLSLYNTDSISTFVKAIQGVPDIEISYTWIWEAAILLGITIVTFVVGLKVFEKKDLPL